jgi:hypothetical protein
MKITQWSKKVLVGSILLIISLLAFTSHLDSVIHRFPVTAQIMRGANEYLNKTTVKALETFAALRVINATISVLKDSKLDASPAGVGVSIAAGEALQPIEDLIEQASTIMLISSASLGVQKVLIKIGSACGITILLGISMLLLSIAIFRRNIGNIDLRKIGYFILGLSVVMTFALPITECCIKVVSDRFLNDEYKKAFSTLETAQSHVSDISLETEKDDNSGVMASIKSKYNNVTKGFDIGEHITSLKDKLLGLTEYVISLIVVFVMQTIILPISILVILLWFVRFIFRPKPYVNTLSKST